MTAKQAEHRTGRSKGLPAIVVDAAHADRLANLAETALDSMPEVASFLLGEIERARVVPAARFPSDAVNMGTWVTFTDRSTEHSRTVQLVYPEEADIAAGRVSVLTPIGAALLGLSPGQRMRWLTRTGAPRDLVVTEVGREPPAGEPSAAAPESGEGGRHA
jgi:regulator of nucleoside diphosphate kinase